MNRADDEYLDARSGLVRVVAEMLLKGLVTCTGCLITLAACLSYLACKLKLVDGDLDWKAVTGMAGLGFFAMVKSYFGKPTWLQRTRKRR